MDAVRWGIVGPGSIAHKFAKGLQAVSDAAVTAVPSRSLERAQAFAQEHGAKHCFDSYEAFAACDDIPTHPSCRNEPPPKAHSPSAVAYEQTSSASALSIGTTA